MWHSFVWWVHVKQAIDVDEQRTSFHTATKDGSKGEKSNDEWKQHKNIKWSSTIIFIPIFPSTSNQNKTFPKIIKLIFKTFGG